MPRLSWEMRLWIAGYVVMLIALVAILDYYRRQAIAELDTAAARSDWQDWKQGVIEDQKRTDLRVQRRPPKSDEPPYLILMRDSFFAVLLTLSLVSSFWYGFFVLVIRGIRMSPGRVELLDDT